MIKWAILLWPVMSLSQPVYLNDDQGEISRAVVNRTLWAVNERFGTDFKVTGTTPLGCIEGAITVRRASYTEWMDAKLPILGGVYALEHRCPSTVDGRAIVFGPDMLNTRPVVYPVLQHEVIHALGVEWHLANPASLMFSGAISAPTTTLEDGLEAARVITWPHSAGDLCFVEVFPNYDFFIPSIAGYEVFASLVAQWKWKVKNYRRVQDLCPSLTFEEGVVHVPDARSEDGRQWEATLTIEGGLWVLQSLKLKEP